MKILTVVGARPQFVKAAVVSRAIKNHNSSNAISSSKYHVDEKILHTGQHYDENMSDVFFEELAIPKPDYNLAIGSGTHGLQTGQMLIEIEKVLTREEFDLLLVYGDTNSTLAAALAASKLNIPIAHVEAGLRSFNRQMPEEINRVLTDHLSKWLFCPTGSAVKNLINEGINTPNVINVGDVMYDAALFYSKMSLTRRSELTDRLPEKFILATVHRPASTDDPKILLSLLEILEEAGKKYFPVFFPLHPRTKNLMKSNNDYFGRFNESNKYVIFSEPLGYLDMIFAEKKSELIMTDSGGVQKEAYFHSKPCITMRSETEWVELVEAGWNYVTGISRDSIMNVLQKISNKDWQAAPRPSLFGNSDAGEMIIKNLIAI
ncbi:MAG: UDP-N-acetylglucosamine 2-epimerase (non-hydrolyzing) [Candidatus Riflebacteria bacterium]|nr:UDP-N-acetylglucosamine 2-epimerase (non-hydrolyzing) [Candidatus Riflebacteria bacterium]